MQKILILNDGETYSSVRGCCIAIITDEEADALDRGQIDCRDLKPIAEIGLDSIAGD